MEGLVQNLLEISIMAGIMILAVLLVRICFKKASAAFRCVLWMLVGIRLLVPVNIAVPFSLVPAVDLTQVREELEARGELRVEQEGVSNGSEANGVQGAGASQAAADGLKSEDLQNATGVSEVEGLQGVTDASKSEGLQSAAGASNADGLQGATDSLAADKTPGTAEGFVLPTLVWLCGMLLMLGYMLVSGLRLHRGLRTAIPETILCGDTLVKVYRDGHISSPFLLGIFAPKIYLPYGLEEANVQYVLAHELMHIRRRDYLLKPLSFLVLSVYWFNPLVWVAYILFGRDIESACDERVMGSRPDMDRAAYAQALLSGASNQRRIAVCPVAFGESDVKRRVKNVLSYKKPGFWTFVICAILGVAIALCFMTVAESKSEEPKSLTMERLLKLTDDGSLEKRIEEKGMDAFWCYDNLVLSKIPEGAVSATYTCDLTYKDKQYEMQLFYRIGKNGAEDTVDTIYISHPAGGEKEAIYTTRNNIETVSLQEFVDYVDRAYSLDSYITYQLPEGFTLGEFEFAINSEALYHGCRLIGDVEEQPHADGGEEYTYAPGGIGTITQMNRFTFENGAPVAISYGGTHRSVNKDSFEQVEGCFTTALLAEVSFDLMTIPEQAAYIEAHPEMAGTPGLGQANHWYIFICDEESEVGYVVYLNQKYFTREDVIAFARSIRPIEQ